MIDDLVDERACAWIAVHVMRLIDHHHGVGYARRVRVHLDALTLESARTRPILKRFEEHVQPAEHLPPLLVRAGTRAEPAQHKEAERLIASDEEQVRAAAGLKCAQHLVHRKVSLARTRRRLHMHPLLARALGQLCLLVWSQLLERQYALLVLLGKLRTIDFYHQHTSGAARSPRLALQDAAEPHLEASSKHLVTLLVQ